MRAYLIEPESRTIKAIDTAGDWDAICGLINSEYVTIGALIHYPDGGLDVVYTDDSQIEMDEDPRCWFEIDNSTPYAGPAVVIGVDRSKPCPTKPDGVSFYPVVVGPDYRGGPHCDARISLEDLTARVAFMRRRVRGYREIWNGDELVRYEIVAPIIEDR